MPVTERVSKESWVFVKNLDSVMTCDLIQVSVSISAAMSILLQQKHTYTYTHGSGLNLPSLNKQCCYSVSWDSGHTNQFQFKSSHTFTEVQAYSTAFTLRFYRLSECQCIQLQQNVSSSSNISAYFRRCFQKVDLNFLHIIMFLHVFITV